jgi:hypothetical protein
LSKFDPKLSNRWVTKDVYISDECSGDSDSDSIFSCSSICDVRESSTFMSISEKFNIDGTCGDIPFIETPESEEDGMSDCDRSGEESDISNPRDNPGWKVMLVKSRKRRPRVKTLVDSGCNCTIFTDRALFSDYEERSISIKTASNKIREVGRGTVGKLSQHPTQPPLTQSTGQEEDARLSEPVRQQSPKS